MAKKNGASESDEGFMLAAYDWMGDIGATTGFGVRVVLTPSKRRGVFLVRAQAVSTTSGKASAVLCERSFEWPNGRATTLAAALFALCTDLAVELDGQSDGRN